MSIKSSWSSSILLIISSRLFSNTLKIDGDPLFSKSSSSWTVWLFFRLNKPFQVMNRLNRRSSFSPRAMTCRPSSGLSGYSLTLGSFSGSPRALYSLIKFLVWMVWSQDHYQLLQVFWVPFFRTVPFQSLLPVLSLRPRIVQTKVQLKFYGLLQALLPSITNFGITILLVINYVTSNSGAITGRGTSL